MSVVSTQRFLAPHWIVTYPIGNHAFFYCGLRMLDLAPIHCHGPSHLQNKFPLYHSLWDEIGCPKVDWIQVDDPIDLPKKDDNYSSIHDNSSARFDEHYQHNHADRDRYEYSDINNH